MAINCPGYFTFFAGHHGVSSIYIQLQPVNINSYACTPFRNSNSPHGDYSIKMSSFTAAHDHHSHSGVHVMHPSAYIDSCTHSWRGYGASGDHRGVFDMDSTGSGNYVSRDKI